MRVEKCEKCGGPVPVPQITSATYRTCPQCRTTYGPGIDLRPYVDETATPVRESRR